jgi:cyclophilin family peptidyl-prolyl cis-trans isomerase
MTPNSSAKLFSRQASLPILSMTAGALLMACGGGDSAAPTITAPTTGSPRYGQTLVLTLHGSDLDRGLVVTSSAACPGAALVNEAPWLSSATTAYYECTVAGIGAGAFVVKSAAGGGTLVTVPFTVPAPQVTMSLSNGAGVDGAVVVTLAPDKAPITANNFLAYVNAGFYDGTVIHRVVKDFVVQGGGYEGPIDASSVQAEAKPPNAPIVLEDKVGLSNTQWTIGMARTNFPNSATSQFFINLVDNSQALDASPSQPGYAVFGSVSAGTGTVNSAVAAPCLPTFISGAGDCTPVPNVVITSARQTR